MARVASLYPLLLRTVRPRLDQENIMKKHLKKLTLHRETLRKLEESALQIAGGAPTQAHCSDGCPVGESVDTPCAPTVVFTCGIECA
jgi:hypothetical protein